MTKKIKISTVFFDLFGVLLGVDQSVIIQYLSKLIELPYTDTREIVLGEIFMQLERGEINLNTYIDIICSSLPFNNRIDKGVLKNMWFDSRVGEMPAVTLLEKLLTHYNVWIITNTSENHIKQLKIQFGFLNHLGDIITSERAGAYKPDTAIFNYALSEAKINPFSALFIDDSLINTRSAESMGIASHHYADFDGLINFLRKYANLV